MTRLICVLLTLLFSLSGSAMGGKSDFGRSSFAAKGLPVPEGLPTTIFGPKQAIHTPGPTLLPGRSPLTADEQALLDGVHAGKHPIIRLNPRGQPVVDFGEVIGVEASSGNATRFGTIHFGQKGAHIVPASPIQY